MSKTTTTLAPIDRKAARYHALRARLTRHYANLQRDIDRAHERHIGKIRAALTAAADAKSALEVEISAAPELFKEPRTLTLHGIRLGIMSEPPGIDLPTKKKAKADVVAAIKDLFSPTEIKKLGLITVTEAPNGKGIEAAKKANPELEIQGVTFTTGGDVVFIKPADHHLDKLISKVLEEGKQSPESEE